MAIQQPDGIQRLTVNGRTDIWPSWYNSKNTGVSKEKLTFNKYNHLLAANCTPDELKVEIEVTKTIDPLTKNAIYSVPEPYDRTKSDTCDYKDPSISSAAENGGRIWAAVTRGSSDYTAKAVVNGQEYDVEISNGNVYFSTSNLKKGDKVKFVITDTTTGRTYESNTVTYSGSAASSGDSDH